MSGELRIALLGQGFMGKAHSNAYVQAPHFYELPYRLRRTVVCGTNPETLAAFAARWEWEATSLDWRSVVTRPDIDVVDIALPNHLHAEPAIAAAKAGKIVFCEKPLANTLAEATRMAAEARHRPSMIWFNYRRLPAVQLAANLVAEWRIGKVFHYRGRYFQQWGPDKRRPFNWKMRRTEAGSGVVTDLLSHALDLAELLNGPIEKLSAATQTFAPGREVEDAAALLLRFANGSLGTVESSRYAIGYRNSNAFEIQGEHGMLRFDLEDLPHLEYFDGRNPDEPAGMQKLPANNANFWKPGHVSGYEHTFIAALAEFLIALQSGQRFRPDFEDGLRIQTLLDAVERSAASGAWQHTVSKGPAGG